MAITLERCLKDGLIKQIPSSPVEAKNQIEKAEVLIMEAKSCFDDDNLNATVMTGYAAMFDAARALLFKDGYRERSHICVVRYLEAKYMKELGEDTIILLDEYREKRHKVVYASDYYPTEEEANNIVNFAEKFIAIIKKLL